ncbi:hypothetical protein BGX33_012286 [Mortierella sp. NVP41]|nr:hypothetical protein BGX33_012286 [Mortierella sp. NVP41]
MDEPGYPQDHKDPSVFVDMTTDNDSHDDSYSAPPPPFSDHDSEDAVPLLADEKKSQDQPIITPTTPEEERSCRGRRCSPEQRARCKAKAKKFFRRLFAGVLLLWAYCTFFGSDYDYDNNYRFDIDDSDYVLVDDGSPSLMPLSAHRQSNLSPKEQADLVFAMSEDECMKNLVPWTGPSTIDTDVRNIKLSVGKGNIFTNVVVRTSAFVDTPTFRLHANVTKNLPEGDDDDDDNDGDDDDDDDDDKTPPKGLHLELKEEEDSLEIVFWADAYLDEPAEEPSEPEPPAEPVPSPPPHHRHRHGRKHHKKHHKKHHDKKHHGMKHHRKHHDRKHRHNDDEESFWMKKRSVHRRRFDDDDDETSGRPKGQKFCATIDVEILLPLDRNSVDRLSVNGVVLHAIVADDLAPVFGEGIDNLEINAVVGEITAESVRANSLNANIVAGSICFEKIQAATLGTAVHVRTAAVAGNITLGVTTTTIDKPEDDNDDDDNDGDDDEECGEGIWKKRFRRDGDGDGDDNDNDGGDDDGEEHPRRHFHHLVKTSVTAGTINLKVTEAEKELAHGPKQIPGMLVVRSGTGAGDIHTLIDLINDRQLSLTSESVGGSIHAKVSDKFLGAFKVTSLFGTADVVEAEDSSSTIDYTTNKKNAKIGRKFIVRDGDDEDDDPDNSVLGDIVLGSPFGRAELEFF